MNKIENNAYIWCLNNGEWGQKLIEEFDADENEFKLEELTYGSNRKIHWKCERGHKWTTMMGTRTINGSGCPFCRTNRVSYPESYIYYALTSIIPNVERNFKLPKELGGYELDICVPDSKLVIEYDGAKWHTVPVNGEFPEGSKERLKSDICKDYGLRLIHIYDGAKCEEPEIHNDLIVYHYTTTYSQLDKVVQILLNELHVDKEIDFKTIKRKALAEKKTVREEKTLAYKFPEIAAEWDYENNDGYTPETISAGSSYKAHWIDEYGHRWIAEVKQRTINGTGCPVCAGKVALEGFNDLQTRLPELSKEWHPTLNDIKPTDVTVSSSKIVYWKCTKCGYGENGEWKAPISRRTAKGYETGCPKCRYNFSTGKFRRDFNVHRKVAVLI